MTCFPATHFNRALKWLVATDPSPNHNRACDLYEELTGQVRTLLHLKVSSKRECTLLHKHAATIEGRINSASPASGLDKSTLLHIAVGYRNERFLRLFVSHGANINQLSPNGFSILAAVMYDDYDNLWNNDSSRTISTIWKKKLVPLIRMLVHELGADLSSKGSCITPLQLTVLFFAESSAIYLEVAQELLRSGADPNAVAEDTTNQTRILDATQTLYYLMKGSERRRLELASTNWRPDINELTERVLKRRGKFSFYDTSLRILERRLRDYTPLGFHGPDYAVHLHQFKLLLERYGARSLHLFPVADLEGYCEDDMRIWKTMQDTPDRNILPSQGTTACRWDELLR